MNATIEKTTLLNTLEKVFALRNPSGNPEGRQALNYLLAKGLPSVKTEEYRFIAITRLLESVMPEVPTLKPGGKISPGQLIPELACNRIVFVNGVYSPEQTEILDSSLTLSEDAPSGAKQTDDPFNLMNRAFCESLIHIHCPAKQEMKHPVAVVYYFDSTEFIFANPRWKFTVGDSGKASLVEYTVAEDGVSFFNNKHTQISAGRQAEIECTTIQRGAAQEIQVNNAFIDLADNSQYQGYTFTSRGRMIRNNLTMAIDGEGINAHLYGLYYLNGQTVADNHTVVDHRKPRSYSNEVYKGILDGNSRGVFNGKIFVRPDAQKTNAFQTNRNLLLSETATIHTKPQLEIWADDVKCSHGCTTGQLDEEALFYLQSRGLSRDAAKGMLLHAYAAETFESMRNETIKHFVTNLVSEQLHQNG
ncbi:MAG: Fe-S cluster assembly protein SufD [Cytophagales bacterium]|nr:Fe-S cluster assembly protein SufD [Cytophagales bacterium]